MMNQPEMYPDRDPLEHETQKKRYQLYIQQFFEGIPLISPQKMFSMLTKLEYKGQDEARQAITLLAYRHVRRLKRFYLDGIPREKLPPKSNYLMIGPTGCGKTFMIELLFRKILKLPAVLVDMTQYSETGYVGNDPCTLLTTLLEHTGHDPISAAAGIICMDEFDKLATTQNQARFDGQGTTKDVSGFGVQRELLKIIEGTEMMVPMDLNNTAYSQRIPLRTEDITFIACGTFSGFKGIASGQQPHIGFTAALQEGALKKSHRIAADFEEQEISDIENFQLYGFIPELMGRFTRIISLRPLDREALTGILKDSVINKFYREFKEEGITLRVEKQVLDYIVEQSFKRQTGARGLASLLTQYIEKAAFQSFCTPVKHVTLRVKGKEIVSELE